MQDCSIGTPPKPLADRVGELERRIEDFKYVGTFKSGETYKGGNTKLICTVVVARVDVQCCVLLLWCSRPAFVSIMRRADSPITQGALDERKAVAWLEWDYAGPGDDGHPSSGSGPIGVT